MPAIAIVGDVATTTALALATSWPADRDVTLVEADRRGGSLAAWLDVPITPSLSSLVAAARRSAPIDPLVRRTDGGLRYVPCPITAREASRAVDEANEHVVPDLVAGPSTVVLDLGRADVGDLPRAALRSTVLVVVHRQERSSPRAAAVRLERLAELVLAARSQHPAVVVAVVGDRPFGADEIAAHCGGDLAGRLVTLADDPLAASVLAGGVGTSARRLRRQPLLRDARRAAAALAALVDVRLERPPSRRAPDPSLAPIPTGGDRR